MEQAVREISRDLTRGDIGIRFDRRGSQIVSTRLHGPEVRHGLTIRRVLDIAFHRGVSCNKTLANIYRLSDTHVRRMRCAVAWTLLQREKSFVQSPKVAALLDGAGFVVSSLAFDETKHKLQMPGLPRASWDVMVSMQDRMLVRYI